MASERTDHVGPVSIIAVARRIVTVNARVEVQNLAVVVIKDADGRIDGVIFCVNTLINPLMHPLFFLLQTYVAF